MTAFVFPAPRRPDVSIVMPTFGRWEWTARALGALLANTEPCYELIVVDNASPDGTASMLAAKVENIQVVQNRLNVGFGLACNQGASCARGDAVVFLNSDALVHAGWLAPLLAAASAPDVGAVGPCFLNLDGSVQEAGALLFRDANTGAYGSAKLRLLDDARRPRVVDYVSAACLLVRRRAFDEVGGFDSVYAPAYFEDVDLCLALAAQGYLTVYEPRSAVTHAHGWSEQSQVDEAALRRNREVFARRWAQVLAARPYARPDVRAVVGARDGPLLDHLLVLAAPSPDRGMRDLALVRRLAGLCPTAHIALVADDPGAGESEELLALGIEPAGREAAPIADWLADRRFHYDAVLWLGEPPVAQVEAVRRTQPQALRLVELDAAAGPEVERRAAVADADALLVASDEDRRAVTAKLPSATVFVVGAQTPDDALADMLVHLGFAAGVGAAGAPRAGRAQPVTV